MTIDKQAALKRSVCYGIYSFPSSIEGIYSPDDLQFQFFRINTSIATTATQQATVAESLSREFIEVFKMEPHPPCSWIQSVIRPVT